jgi:hypothetical protein
MDESFKAPIAILVALSWAMPIVIGYSVRAKRPLIGIRLIGIYALCMGIFFVSLLLLHFLLLSALQQRNL